MRTPRQSPTSGETHQGLPVARQAALPGGNLATSQKSLGSRDTHRLALEHLKPSMVPSWHHTTHSRTSH
eukprot:1397770-Amphidinium_carterae.2